ncbi:MAG: Ig-like domain-containing protein [Deltaproteobacteria bacterium]|nr:Ig-like domain-containing protein [Deltaproteobacteria bacterium]
MRTTKTLAASSLFLFALAAGCGGDDEASLATGVKVQLSPEQAFYPVNSQLTLTATVTDGAGTEIRGAKVAWKADPAEAATQAGDTGAFTLNRLGPVTFTACSVDNASACGSARIRVSPGGPALVVESPVPGAELGGDNKGTFVVVGRTTTGASVFVNGAPAPVAPDGAFKVEVVGNFGVNHLVVSSTNGQDPEVRRELDFAFGGSYAPAVDEKGAPAFSAADALVLDLGQRFFDDGTAVPLDAPKPVTLPDMADVIARIVAGMDIMSKLPNPLIASNGVNLTVGSAKMSDVRVETELAGDGLDLFVRVGKLALGTTGSLDLSGSAVSLNGGVEASLSAYAHATIKKANPNAPVTVTMGTFDVALETATGKFNDPQANAIFALAAGFLRTTVEGMVKTALGDALVGSVPTALESVFESLDTALANKSFDIDAAPLPKVALTIDGHLSAIDLAAMGSMRAKLALAAKTDRTAATHPKSRGVALVDTSSAESLFASPRAQLSVKLAALNGLLHTLWNAGLLEIPKSDALPLTVTGQLPPIVRLPRQGETDDLVVSLGQLELLPGGVDTNGRLGVLIEAGLSIELADESLKLKLAEKPSVKVWTIKEPPGDTLFTPKVIEDLLLKELWPKLRAGITSGLSIKLPLPPLGAVASVAPSLTGLTLKTGLNRRVAYRNGFLVLDAKLEGFLP